MKPQEISIVIPVYNEEENVAPLAREIHAALDGHFDYEIIFVDDGSNDATPLRLRELAKMHFPLRVITHRRNYGQSTALRTGVRAALASWIVTLDGDGQNDPADIAKLWAVLRAPDQPAELRMVAGYRRKRQDSWLKRFSSRVANTIRSRLLSDHTPDTGCGLKLFSKDAFLDLPFFDHMHRFLPALIQRDGGQVVSVEVNHRPRREGVSKYGVGNRLWVGIIDLLGVMWLQRRGRIPAVLKEPNNA